MLEREAAKYPFLTEAAKLVDALNLQLDDLASPAYEKVLDRAAERVVQAIEDGAVDDALDDYMTELLSFPIAVMFVSAKGEPFLNRRYALAEAVRVYFLLQDEERDKLAQIARDDFGWALKDSGERYDGVLHDFRLHFHDYLRSSSSFHEDKWKLVNRIVKNGYVLLTQREVARLIQGEAEILIKDRLKPVKINLPEPIQRRLDRVSKVFEENRTRLGGEGLPSEVINEAFPPCIRFCMEGLLAGRRASHMERFALTSFLVTVGMPLDSLVDLYTSVSDFDPAMTKYQVEHIAGVKGNRTKYTPPLCDTLRTHGICRNKDDICERIKHPLSYYRIKARRLAYQKPPLPPQASNITQQSQ
ncbi:TPA: DNA primase large subunit PriL [Candidatus Bathyarchaeota archaeon]|nr:DNA primase large subunit PriL [Candidatus Bathyarchaeota archaeon]